MGGAQVLVNALIVQVKSAQTPLSGKATNRDLTSSFSYIRKQLQLGSYRWDNCVQPNFRARHQ
jgi:hypothetical protein